MFGSRAELNRIRRSGPIPASVPLEQVRAPSAALDASERTGSRLTFRLVVTAGVVVVLFGALLVRLWILQVTDGPSLNNLAQASTTQLVPVAPARGEILASGGQVLAGNVATEQVTVDPSVVAVHGSVVPSLASLLNVGVGAIEQAIEGSTKENGYFVPVVVPTGPAGVTDGDVAYIDAHPTIFPGVSVGPGYRRTYPYGALASQTLGFLSELTPGTITGSSGLEAEYERELHGKSGTQQIYVNRTGTFVGNGVFHAPVAGDNVVLNLSVGVEETLTNDLETQVAALRAGKIADQSEVAPWAAGVVMDNTGHVLAIASVPGYNANALVIPRSTAAYNAIANAPGSPLTNYPIQGLSPPGSTFKLATATSALDSGLISPYTTVVDTGTFTFGTGVYHDSDGEVLGPVDVTTALSESSDYFFYNIGKLYWEKNPNATPIQDTARSYGITEPSGIDLPNGTYPPKLGDEEVLGDLDSAALRRAQHAEDPSAFPNTGYYGGDSVLLAIGQDETEVTALAMADAYQTFVNHGTRYAPELAKEIVSPSGKVVRTIAPKVMGHVLLPESTWAPMMAGFEGAVNSPKGTAYNAFTGFNFSSWDVAGKTGTADVTTTGSTAPTAWFIGFGGPRGSAKKYIVAIEIDQAGFGADAAAPVARQIFDYLQAHGT